VGWVGGGEPPEGLRAGVEGGAAWDAAACYHRRLYRRCSQPPRKQEAIELGGETMRASRSEKAIGVKLSFQVPLEFS